MSPYSYLLCIIVQVLLCSCSVLQCESGNNENDENNNASIMEDDEEQKYVKSFAFQKLGENENLIPVK